MVRPTVEADFPAIAEITNHYILTTAIHFGYEAVTAEELCAAWREGLAVYPWFTAEEGAAVIGYAKAGLWRARAAYRWTAEVGLYVHPQRRGGGIGTRLYTALLDELRARGFRSAVGGVTLPNEASVKLHEKLAFTCVGRFAQAGYKMDRWHDVAFFQRMLP
ncbi:MAG: N-acetyltransferase family protein [Phycisphaerales bacterium]|nr:N-acetyltransferase family protein [Phycisphaerales bacterium]